jgi:hypothetical protein
LVRIIIPEYLLREKFPECFQYIYVCKGTCTADSSTGIISNARSNARSTAKILASSIGYSVDLAACRWHTDVELDVVLYN